MSRDKLPEGVISNAKLRVYVAICWYIDRHGRPPTIRKLGAMLGRRNNAIQGSMMKLKKMGLLEIEPGTARAYKPLYRVEVA